MSNKRLYEIGVHAWGKRDFATSNQRLHDCVDAVAAAVRAEFKREIGNIPLPEPKGYAWLLTDGRVEFTEDECPPVSREEWDVASALFDADQLRDFVRVAVAQQEPTK